MIGPDVNIGYAVAIVTADILADNYLKKYIVGFNLELHLRLLIAVTILAFFTFHPKEANFFKQITSKAVEIMGKFIWEKLNL